MNIREYEFLRCRAIAHVWQDHHPLRKARSGAVLSLQCATCGMLREDVVSRATGELIDRSYKRPKGYKDEARTKDDYRKALIVGAIRVNGRSAR